MARPSICNPLPYVVGRQIDERTDLRKHLVNARFKKSENLFRKDLFSHYGCVNAIEFSNQEDLLISGGDDRRVLLWKVEQAVRGIGKPAVMRAQHVSNIFCLGYDSSNSKIFSAGNDDQVIIHDLRTGNPLNFFLHEKAVYGLSIHPENDNVFSSACDDGRVLIYDIRNSSSTEAFCLAQYKTAFHSVMFNPIEPKMLATANVKEGISMWDVRKPLEPVLRYGIEGPSQSCMNVRFNTAGNRLLALRRRLPPVLYAVNCPTHLCQFDHPGYYNSCTMKSCCFAGNNDEYVLSGSDDFKLYMWKIPDDDTKWVESAHMILQGHRSIVNQVRFNQTSCLFASSGVEKIIKLWSPFPLGSGCFGGLKKNTGKQERQRRVFMHDEYMELVVDSGQFMTHDYSHQSTREDPQMMAFFDSLVQREIEEWSSEDVPTAHQTSSDSENNPATAQTYSATDSDVSSRGSSGGGVAPERPSGSPNRITRLIANCREKLMRLAAVEGGATVNAVPAKALPEWSGSASATEDAVRIKSKSKSKSKLKGVKRKHSRAADRRTKARKKSTVRSKSDAEDSDETPEQQQQQPVDTAQPSTSSGVISRRSRYAAAPVDSDSRHSSRSRSRSRDSSSSSSGSSVDGRGTLGKRRQSKTDSDSSGNKAHRRKHKKSRHNLRRECGKSKKKRQRIDDETEEEVGTTKDCLNGTSASNARRVQEDGPSTPSRKSCRVPVTPDSGITSGVSTVEKNGSLTQKGRSSGGGGGDSSDHEQKLKNLERFRKKVDVTRRSYRNRFTPTLPPQPVSTTTDSSD